MPNTKLQRINEDIQRVLATHIRSIKDPRVNQGMISVTYVDTTSDLHQAKVYLSVFGLQSEKEFMKGLKSASGFLRHELGQSLKLRHTPELIFELDKSIERGARISTLLNSLEIPNEPLPTSGTENHQTQRLIYESNEQESGDSDQASGDK